MKPQLFIELLTILWPDAGRTGLVMAGRQNIEVVRTGEYDDAAGRFTGAGVVIGGVVYNGDVVVWAGDKPPVGNFENCVLQVVPYPCAGILKHDGSPVSQAVLSAGPLLELAYETLKEGAGKFKCAKYIALMEDHKRVAMFTRLETDRLMRKSGEALEIYGECNKNWNETMYVMLMRTMGDRKNKEAFTELARRVKYTMISQEGGSLTHVESLLLGTSGLLELYGDDSYVRDLKTAYRYLQNKHGIMPMEAGQWDIRKNNPNNHPVLRIAQMAAFLTTREFIFDNMMKCRTVEDIHMLFRAEASQYWSTHFVPSVRSFEYPKRVGHFKANLLGINLVATMMFAFGRYLGEESMKELAIDILEKLTCEENQYIDQWRRGGVRMESAFDSQAMMQLNNEYCMKGLCWKCPVGRRVINTLSLGNNNITTGI